jgi:hypothetical protein
MGRSARPRPTKLIVQCSNVVANAMPRCGAFGEDCGGHLTEQRLEQVMVGLGDHPDQGRSASPDLEGDKLDVS